MHIKEIRDGDTNQRAGIVITNGELILCCQPTNMYRNGWKLDLFKGHIQKGETPKEAAIRECWEESGIRFEPWKLTNPIQVSCDGHPLYLFLAKIDGVMLHQLSCASTFIDDWDGKRKPEVEAYRWINPRTELCLVQTRLHVGIRYYFPESLTEQEQDEDCQIAGGMLGSVPANINKVLSLGYKRTQESPLQEMAKVSIKQMVAKIVNEIQSWHGNVDAIKKLSTLFEFVRKYGIGSGSEEALICQDDNKNDIPVAQWGLEIMASLQKGYRQLSRYFAAIKTAFNNTFGTNI